MNKKELVELLDKYHDDVRIFVNTNDAMVVLGPEHFKQSKFPHAMNNGMQAMIIDIEV